MDFDGDQAYVQFYTDPLDAAQIIDLTPDKSWFYDKKHASMFTPKHEVMYGLYCGTKIEEPKDGKLEVFQSLGDAENSYKMGRITPSQKVIINDKATTYGRAKLSSLIGIDIESITLNKEGGPEPVSSKSISKIVSAMGYHKDSVQEYKAMQDFASEMNSYYGMGNIPYTELYDGDPKVIEEILSTDESIYVKKDKLFNYFKSVVQENIDKLPESNANELFKTLKKVDPDSITQLYAPNITTENGEIDVSSSIFNGLDERHYLDNAQQNRMTLQMKADLTPVTGYDQRQLTNLEIKLVYKDEIGSSDTTGILMDGDMVVGRYDMKGNRILHPVDKPMRIKSCIMTDSVNVYRDEISNDRFVVGPDKTFTIKNNAAIGIAFASAITEAMVQGSLAFKHGGALQYESSEVVVAREYGTVISIDNYYVTIKGNHEYKYRITNNSNVVVKINDTVNEGDTVIKHSLILRADHEVSKFDTLIRMDVSGDLGAYTSNSMSVAPVAGKIKYEKNSFSIGNYSFPYDESCVYYYPDGYDVEFGTIISSGVPDMNYVHSITQDHGKSYYIFYKYIMTLNVFKGYNTEIYETLYKCIKDYGYSVKTAIRSNPDLIEKLYYGNSTKSIENALKNTEVTEDGKVVAPLGNSILLSIILADVKKNGNGSTPQLSTTETPTIE